MIAHANEKYRDVLLLSIIFFVAAFTRLLFFGYPTQVVFDETYSGRFAAGYLTGGDTFSSHPPLGMLIISGAAWLGGADDPATFSGIGQHLSTKAYLPMRLLISLFGIALPLVIFMIGRRLGFSRVVACTAGLLLALDNALVVQSRFIMTDMILIVFGFVSIALYLRGAHEHSARLKLLAALFAGAAVSVKWTGLSFIAIISLLELFEAVKRYHRAHTSVFFIFLKHVILKMVFPALLIYFLAFAVHFMIKGEFRPSHFLNDVYHEHSDMLYSNAHMKPHPAQSKWYEWPLSLEPISYWYGNVEKGKIVQRIDLAGNIFVYLLSSFFVIIATGVAFKCLVRFFKRKYRLRHDDKALIFLVVCYWMNVLPFILISRPMFLYHYFVAFVFSVLIFMQLLSRFFRHEEEQIKVICYALVSISALIFLLSSSHTYGYRPYKNVPQIPVWGLEEKRF